MLANSSFILSISKPVSNKKASVATLSIEIIATLSLGIAFRKLPPLISDIRKPKFVKPSNKSRFIILLAFPSPLIISIPECPPFNPFTEMVNPVVLSALWSSRYVLLAVRSIPPAQPIPISSSSSVSRFKRISPFKMPLSNPIAPVIPVSSSMVKSASKLGCSMAVEAKTAIIEATPKPLSAPSVVPSAVTQSPSTSILIPSVSKSKIVSAFF